jgi:hypothetical protein
MPDLTGHWKGLAVSRNIQGVVHLYFEQNQDALSGRFEASEHSGPDSKGAVTGSIGVNNAVKLTVDTSGQPEFTGHLTGEGTTHEMIYGVVRTPAAQQPIGTLTLFRYHHREILPQMY